MAVNKTYDIKYIHFVKNNLSFSMFAAELYRRKISLCQEIENNEAKQELLLMGRQWLNEIGNHAHTSIMHTRNDLENIEHLYFKRLCIDGDAMVKILKNGKFSMAQKKQKLSVLKTMFRTTPIIIGGNDFMYCCS